MSDTPKPTYGDESDLSPTARPSPDTIGIGRTAGQRTAEILAGLRAELEPTLLHQSLTNMGGDIAARLLKAVISTDTLNFAIGRTQAFSLLVEEAMGGQEGKIYVDLAAGLSPRGFQMARKHSDWTVIEVDLPDVVRDKERRISRKFNVSEFANMNWHGADLATTTLLELLPDVRPDVITAEGLLPYLTLEQVQRLLAHSYEKLKPGGTVIMDVGSEEGESNISKALNTFMKYANLNYTETMSWKTRDTAQQLFEEAGFEAVQVYHIDELAERFDLLTPLPHVVFIVVATKAGDDADDTLSTAPKIDYADSDDDSDASATDAPDTDSTS